MMAAHNNQQIDMTLKQLLTGFSVSDYLPEVAVKGMTLDSRKIEPGYVFVALEGQYDHGLGYAEAAVSRGAVAVLCDAKFDQYCQQILSRLMSRAICVPVDNLQNKLGELANKLYDMPSTKMFVTGITGTDGKTSVSHFIAQALNQADGSAAVIGTLGNGSINKLEESTHTTPDVISLHEMLSDFTQQGIDNVAMEVSSHGLDQGRSSAVEFDVSVLTNLTRDHLDYHGDIAAYKQAKKKLFSQNINKAMVLNIDDEFGEELFAEYQDSKRIWLYGFNEEKAKLSKTYVYASNIKNQANGIDFMLNSSQGTAEVTVKLIGEFNVCNVLACCCVLLEKGVNFNHAIRYIEKLTTVPGRMELISEKNKPLVVIDYAHTPEALSQALKNVRKHVEGKVVCVFGCGGDRDKGKRKLMAETAEQLSDLIIVTSDNPRTENPENIIDDIKKGVSNELKLIVETDRGSAIHQAINMAGENDLVLIAGKGHEQFQLINNEKIPFSDKQVATAALGVNQ